MARFSKRLSPEEAELFGSKCVLGIFQNLAPVRGSGLFRILSHACTQHFQISKSNIYDNNFEMQDATKSDGFNKLSVL